MVGAQAVFPLAGFNGIRKRAHIRITKVRVFIHADAQRIEHGGDAGTRDLGVVGLHGGNRAPAHLGTRRIVGFQVVGMQLDQARQQEVAFAIVPIDLGR